MNSEDIKTIIAFDLLLEEESGQFSALADLIEQCTTYKEVAALLDKWLQKNPAIEGEYNQILVGLNEPNKQENSRFFQGIKNNPQNEDSLHRETVTILTNKMRNRSTTQSGPASPPTQAHDTP